MAAISKGITATFGAFDFVIEDVQLPEKKSTAIKTTHQGSSENDDGVIVDTFIPSGVVDPGTCKFKVQVDPLDIPPVGTADTLTVVIPGLGISGTDISHIFSNTIFVSETHDNAAVGALLTGTYEFKLSGDEA